MATATAVLHATAALVRACYGGSLATATATGVRCGKCSKAARATATATACQCGNPATLLGACVPCHTTATRNRHGGYPVPRTPAKAMPALPPYPAVPVQPAKATQARVQPATLPVQGAPTPAAPKPAALPVGPFTWQPNVRHNPRSKRPWQCGLCTLPSAVQPNARGLCAGCAASVASQEARLGHPLGLPPAVASTLAMLASPQAQRLEAARYRKAGR